jgi:hypothetical protein
LGPFIQYDERKVVNAAKTLTDHFEKEWIRVSKSPAGAPVFFVRKPDGGLRFCMNYRKFNEITKRKSDFITPDHRNATNDGKSRMVHEIGRICSFS